MQQAPQVSEPGLRFESLQEVRWGDQDALNHVNNTVYFRYIEEARVQLFTRMGMTLPSERAVVLAHTSLDFLRPVLYPARVRIVIELVRIGRSSLELNNYVVHETDDTIVYATGRNVLVATDLQGASRPWETEEIESLQQAMQE